MSHIRRLILPPLPAWAGVNLASNDLAHSPYNYQDVAHSHYRNAVGMFRRCGDTPDWHMESSLSALACTVFSCSSLSFQGAAAIKQRVASITADCVRQPTTSPIPCAGDSGPRFLLSAIVAPLDSTVVIVRRPQFSCWTARAIVGAADISSGFALACAALPTEYDCPIQPIPELLPPSVFMRLLDLLFFLSIFQLRDFQFPQHLASLQPHLAHAPRVASKHDVLWGILNKEGNHILRFLGGA